MSSGAPPSQLLFDGPPVDLMRLARRALWVTVGIVVLFGVLDVFVNWKEWIDSKTVQELCNPANEDSISTWYASTLYVLVGLVALITAWALRRRRGEAALRVGCCLVGYFFIYLGLDDSVELHESLGTAFADMHGGEEAQLSYGWQKFVLPVYLVIGVTGLVLVGPGLRRRGLLGWFLAGGALMAFAQGLDFLEGLHDRHGTGAFDFNLWCKQTADAWGVDKYDIKHPILLIEELCETLGVSFIGQAFLRLLARVLDGTRLSLVAGASARRPALAGRASDA